MIDHILRLIGVAALLAIAGLVGIRANSDQGLIVPGVQQQGAVAVNQMAYWTANNTIAAGYTLNAGAMMQTNPIAGGTADTNVFTYDFVFTPGSVGSLVANVKTVTINGLLTTDAVSLSCTDSFALGANIANVRVSAANTLEMTITTAVVLGVTLGSLHFRLTVVRA